MSLTAALYFESLTSTNEHSDVLELHEKDTLITKGKVWEYYSKVANYIFPYLKNRPQALKRDNSEVMQELNLINQKQAAFSYQNFYEFSSYEPEVRDADCIVCYNKETIEYIINLGCVEMAPWHSSIDNLDSPDYLVISIEPSKKNTFFQSVRVAKTLKSIIDKAGAESFLKTSGDQGLHIYIPTGKKYLYRMVRELAYTICLHANLKLPELTSLKKDQAIESQKIYLNYQLNRRGLTTVAPYSIRNYPWAPVSTPILWSELKDDLNPYDFNINTIPSRIEKVGDIFSGLLERSINLENCMKAIQFE